VAADVSLLPVASRHDPVPPQPCIASTDPDASRRFDGALGLEFKREMPIVRNGELEAINYLFAPLREL
jgi:hypothetical protein